MASNTGGLIIVVLFLIIYSSLFLMSIIRIRKITQFPKRDKIAKVFYVLVIIFIVLRIIGFSLIVTTFKYIGRSVSFICVDSPIALSMILFIILGVLKFEKTYEGHIASHFTQTFVANSKKTLRIEKFKPILVGFLVFYLVFVICFYLFVLINLLSAKVVEFTFSVIEVITSSVILIMTLTLNRKFSGIPTKSSVWTRRLKRINYTVIFWIFARYLSGFLGIFNVISSEKDIKDATDGNIDQLNLSLELVNIFVSEVLCIIITIDYEFISIFIQDSQINALPLLSKRLSMISLNPYINEDEIIIGEEIETKPNNLGKIFKGTHFGKESIYRKITLTNVSTYVIEEIQNEVESYKECCIEGLVPIEAVIIEKSIVGFVYPFYPNGSLYSLIHTSSRKLTQQEKIAILQKVAEIISLIHSENKIHGHLTSYNVLIDSNFEPLVADLGFHKLKKYAGIKNQYSYKSAWSCPEILSDNRITPQNLLTGYDIYSFGMICWEIFTEQVPFSGYSIDQIKKQVVEENARPRIPENLDTDLTKLIQSCFNVDALKRPDINLLLTSLK